MGLKTISIGCDHAGFDYKQDIIDYLQEQEFEVIDHGTHSTDSVDYPDFIHPVAMDLEAGRSRFGVILCGSANGAAMTANKHQHVRAAVCWRNELSMLARLHNDANILAIPARFVDAATALLMLQTFLDTAFEGGRHQRRVDKIAAV